MHNTPQTLTMLNDESLSFPPVSQALSDPNGLLALGGDLTPERIIRAYSKGIFPWYSDYEPIMWWSPDPRAVIFTDQFRINRTFRKFLKSCSYRVTLNQAFEEVIEFCADAPHRKEGTWITEQMAQAYIALHQLSHAHSIEIWQDSRLIGGLYGIAIGQYFSGESMFYLEKNASKVALYSLNTLLARQGVKFIDCQLTNPFLEDMGCTEISRSEFIRLQKQNLTAPLPQDFWQAKELQLLHETRI